MSTLVSIITPSYNQSDYIKDTIASVQNQSYRPIEHIIMDGGSTDATVEILKAYQLDPKGIQVTWVSEKDRGQANAINKGIKLAHGDIIGWINSDDVYFYKNVVDRAVDEFAKHPDIDLIHGDVAKIGSTNLIHFIWCIPEFNYDRMYVDGKISQPTVFFRREIFDQHLLREGFLALDFEFWLRLGRSYKFKHLNVIMAGDREQPDRISFKKNAELRQAHLNACAEYFSNPPVFKIFWFRLSSFPIRLLFRIKGLIQLLALFTNPAWRENLAFDGFIDSKRDLIFRQCFRRIGK